MFCTYFFGVRNFSYVSACVAYVVVFTLSSVTKPCQYNMCVTWTCSIKLYNTATGDTVSAMGNIRSVSLLITRGSGQAKD